MEPRISLEELREVFLSAEESQAARFVAVLVSVGLAAIVLVLVRRRSLREEYTPIWLGVAAGLLLVSLRFDLLKALTRRSRASVQLKNLGQEVAILRAKVDELERPTTGGPAPDAERS